MDDRLWTPQKVMPDQRHKEGGSMFDDQMENTEDLQKRVAQDMATLIDHLQKRPDHTVYVGSSEDRDKLRQVFNHWYMNGVLTHHPHIRIEYGVPDGAIRLAE